MGRKLSARFVVLPEAQDRDLFSLWEAGGMETQNASELRLSKFQMVLHSGPRVRHQAPRGAAQEAEELAREKNRKWRLSTEDWVLAVKHCD